MAEQEIKLNEEAFKFETSDKEAFLQYKLVGAAGDGATTCMDMVHTFVPRSKRGMGMAAKLCDAAFQYAESKGFSVIPSCSYISDTYLPKKPEWNAILYKDQPKSSI